MWGGQATSIKFIPNLMIDVFVDVLGKLAADGIYNKAVDPSIAFSTFYAILTDQQLVGHILSLYFHRHPQHPTKTAILCLCEELFGEKTAATLVKTWPIASSKVSDLAERLHARICVSNTSNLNMSPLQDMHTQCITKSPTLTHLKRQLEDLIQGCRDTVQQIAPQTLLPLLQDMADTLTKLSQESSNIHDSALAEKEAQIRDLRQRISELEAGLSDMCANIEVYMKQMEAYSHEMAAKNEQILSLHQQLKDVRVDSSDRELTALRELLNEKDRLISSVRADLAESTATSDRLAQECVHLNKRNEELSVYKSLITTTVDVLKTLSEKDTELSYSPPTDDTYLKLPEYIAFIIDVIRTKAHWLATDDSGRDLPLPSQDTSPLLQPDHVQSKSSPLINDRGTAIPLTPNSNHLDAPRYHHLFGNPNTSILGRLAMVGRDKNN